MLVAVRFACCFYFVRYADVIPELLSCTCEILYLIIFIVCFFVLLLVFITQYCYSKSFVCPSVTLMYHSSIGWVSSKVITVFAPWNPNIVQGEHPLIRVE